MAQDAGTYLYNGKQPWKNALTQCSAHNTLMINNLDQMTRAGRFLYLDWAQAVIESTKLDSEGSLRRLAAHHDGYKRLGVLHRRDVTSREDGSWLVDDRIHSIKKTSSSAHPRFNVSLHWLIHDLPWTLDHEQGNRNIVLSLESPHGRVYLRVSTAFGQVEEQSPEVLASPQPTIEIQLIRAGKTVHGPNNSAPILGWRSPIYGEKIPALSLRINVDAQIPVTFFSEWELLED